MPKSTPRPTSPIVTNRLRRLRFDHGEMTQEQLADRAGVTRQTIIALEANKYVPSLLLALRFSRIFALPIEGIFEYHEP